MHTTILMLLHSTEKSLLSQHAIQVSEFSVLPLKTKKKKKSWTNTCQLPTL